MESSATSANLALDMKQSEVAVRDLNTLVRFWFPMLLVLASHSLRSNGLVCLAERYCLAHWGNLCHQQKRLAVSLRN